MFIYYTFDTQYRTHNAVDENGKDRFHNSDVNLTFEWLLSHCNMITPLKWIEKE